ncbi:hypothetical protein [Parasphingorhabdus sp.]|uniref:hypothetical protein n=1 Tax=Parasphingorhabdus sp. TaxID=2709688 RepID=UPI003A91F4B3
MIGPIFYILLVFALVVGPAFAGWKLSRKHGQSVRMAGTVMAGQLVLTPVMAYIIFSKSTIVADNPVKTALTYAAMGVVISIMTFVVLEIRNTTKSRKATARATGIDTGDDPAIVEPL